MRKVIFLLIMLGAGWHLYKLADQDTYAPGIQAKEVPHQENLDSSVIHTLDDYTVTGLAKFHIKAKVLSKENYYFDRESDISPTDLALGWGKMSDDIILDKIDISQSGRFYRWHVNSFPIPRREIETHSANMHLIPANDSIKSDIDEVRKGDVIEISGSLVEVKSNTNGWRWKSSLTRNDTGKGACELILVESISIVTP